MSKAIAKNKLGQLWERLASRGPLFLPVAESDSVSFRLWEPEAVVDLETVNSTVSPKGIFLPQDQVYLQFKREGTGLQMQPVEQPAGPAVAFGVRACDLKAFGLLDKVYAEQDPPDRLYTDRRANTAVVVLACSEPDPYCFCSVFGIDPAGADGADVAAWWEGEELILEARTPKGEAVLETAGDLLEEKSAVGPVSPETADFGLNLEGLPKNLKERFEDPVWDDLFRSCLGCGTCTFICPTCYCFDVEDYGHTEEGHRFRCWDSCMYKQFTLLAGGANPRPTRKERVRNRFLHKLQYYPENFGGEFACVGCGRCLRSCPVNLDIVQAIRALGGETVAKS